VVIASLTDAMTMRVKLMCNITIRLTAAPVGPIVCLSHTGTTEGRSSSTKRFPHPTALRFFCARLPSYGREGDGYNTPKGESSPPGFVRASNLPATRRRRVEAAPLRFNTHEGVATP